MNKLKNLIDRDSLGEKIIFLYQEQVDKLIEIIESIPEYPLLQVKDEWCTRDLLYRNSINKGAQVC